MDAHLPAGEVVAVTVLRGVSEHVGGSVEAHEGQYLKLRVDRALPSGTPLKVEWHSALFLAEVTSCGFEGGHYSVSLETEHALYDTEELARLASRLLAGSY